MLKMGLPVGAVKNALQRDGKDPSIMDLDPDKSVKSQLGGGAAEDDGPPLKEDPEYEKYFKMLKMGLPMGAVKNALQRDGKDPSIMDLDPEKSIKSQMGGGGEPEPKDEGPPLKEDPDYQKYFKMLKMGLPIGAVQNAMQRDGKDPSIMDLDPEKSVAYQIAMKNRKASGGKGGKGGPPKKKKKKVRRKKIYWTPLDPSKVIDGTLWSMVKGELDMEKLSYDRAEFDSLFTESTDPADKKKKAGAKQQSSNKKKKKEQVQVIDGKRSMNGGIVLARLKMSYERIAEMVNEMDAGAFDGTQLKALKEFLPTDEERTSLQGFLQGGDVNDLPECEKYMVAMKEVKDPDKKFDAMLFKEQFDVRLEELMDGIGIVRTACVQVRDSTRLRKLMAMILLLVNQINTGGDGNLAQGFNVEALLKLGEAKAFDKKTSVLHYLAKLVRQNDEALLKFTDDIDQVPEAENVILDGLAGDVKNIKSELDKVAETALLEADRLENEGALVPLESPSGKEEMDAENKKDTPAADEEKKEESKEDEAKDGEKEEGQKEGKEEERKDGEKEEGKEVETKDGEKEETKEVETKEGEELKKDEEKDKEEEKDKDDDKDDEKEESGICKDFMDFPEGRTKMERFTLWAQAKVEKTVASLETLKETYKRVLAYFGEDEKMPSNEFFGTLQKFVVEFEAAAEYVEKIEKAKLKEKLKKAAKRAATIKALGNGGNGKDGEEKKDGQDGGVAGSDSNGKDGKGGKATSEDAPSKGGLAAMAAAAAAAKNQGEKPSLGGIAAMAAAAAANKAKKTPGENGEGPPGPGGIAAMAAAAAATKKAKPAAPGIGGIAAAAAAAAAAKNKANDAPGPGGIAAMAAAAAAKKSKPAAPGIGGIAAMAAAAAAAKNKSNDAPGPGGIAAAAAAAAAAKNKSNDAPGPGGIAAAAAAAAAAKNKSNGAPGPGGIAAAAAAAAAAKKAKPAAPGMGGIAAMAAAAAAAKNKSNDAPGPGGIAAMAAAAAAAKNKSNDAPGPGGIAAAAAAAAAAKNKANDAPGPGGIAAAAAAAAAAKKAKPAAPGMGGIAAMAAAAAAAKNETKITSEPVGIAGAAAAAARARTPPSQTEGNEPPAGGIAAMAAAAARKKKTTPAPPPGGIAAMAAAAAQKRQRPAEANPTESEENELPAGGIAAMAAAAARKRQTTPAPPPGGIAAMAAAAARDRSAADTTPPKKHKQSNQEASSGDVNMRDVEERQPQHTRNDDSDSESESSRKSMDSNSSARKRQAAEVADSGGIAALAAAAARKRQAVVRRSSDGTSETPSVAGNEEGDDGTNNIPRNGRIPSTVSTPTRSNRDVSDIMESPSSKASESSWSVVESPHGVARKTKLARSNPTLKRTEGNVSEMESPRQPAGGPRKSVSRSNADRNSIAMMASAASLSLTSSPDKSSITRSDHDPQTPRHIASTSDNDQTMKQLDEREKRNSDGSSLSSLERAKSFPLVISPTPDESPDSPQGKNVLSNYFNQFGKKLESEISSDKKTIVSVDLATQSSHTSDPLGHDDRSTAGQSQQQEERKSWFAKSMFRGLNDEKVRSEDDAGLRPGSPTIIEETDEIDRTPEPPEAVNINPNQSNVSDKSINIVDKTPPMAPEEAVAKNPSGPPVPPNLETGTHQEENGFQKFFRRLSGRDNDSQSQSRSVRGNESRQSLQNSLSSLPESTTIISSSVVVSPRVQVHVSQVQVSPKAPVSPGTPQSQPRNENVLEGMLRRMSVGKSPDSA